MLFLFSRIVFHPSSFQSVVRYSFSSLIRTSFIVKSQMIIHKLLLLNGWYNRLEKYLKKIKTFLLEN